MTLGRPREITTTQLQFGGGDNRNAERLLLVEVRRAHGQTEVDGLIREFDLETVFGSKPGTASDGSGADAEAAGAVTIRPSHLQPQCRSQS